MKNEETNAVKKPASLLSSGICLMCIVAFIAVGVGVFGANIALMLFISWLIAAPFAMCRGYKLSEIETSAYEMAKKCIWPAAIILAVGIMIAAFLAAGTVPTILVLGLRIITPKLFLLLTFVLCCIMSTITGTSWGTIGTVGIAMFGVGAGLGVNPAITVGAIVSGSWFGDKMSPMSDSTIMCSTITGTDIMAHIRHMMTTTIPAAVLAAILYLVIGLTTSGKAYDATTVNGIIEGLQAVYHIDLLAVVPIIVVIVLIAMRKSTTMSLLIGSVVAAIIAIAYQGFAPADVLNALANGFSLETDNAVLSTLLNRGGMFSMINLVGTFVGGLGLGGILEGTGTLKPLFDALTGKVKSSKSVLIAAWAVTLLCILVIADNNFAFVMVGTLFAPIVKQYRLKSENLSRILEDVGTLGSALVPWNVGSMFVVGMFGVSTLQFAPYAFLNYLVPIISLIFILTGFKIKKEDAVPAAVPEE